MTDEKEYVKQPHGGALTPFKKGQNGGAKGRKKGSKNKATVVGWFLDALLLSPDSMGIVGDGDHDYECAVIKKQLLAALNGSLPAAQWLLDLKYGKTPDIIIGDPYGGGQVQDLDVTPEQAKASYDKLRMMAMPVDLPPDEYTPTGGEDDASGE